MEVAPRNATADRVDQEAYVVGQKAKAQFLADMIQVGDWSQVLVFTRTKHGANRLAKHLDGQRIAAMAIHANKSQSAREKALSLFKSNRVRVLVATDIAARGLDIADLPHVVNYELPNIPEDYVHRIGRTGRAGKAGQAVSLVSDVEEGYLWDIEKLLKKEIPRYRMNADGEKVAVAKPATRSALKRPALGQNNQRRGGGGGKRRAQSGKPKTPQGGGGRRDNRRSRGRNR